MVAGRGRPALHRQSPIAIGNVALARLRLAGYAHELRFGKILAAIMEKFLCN
jgi:hypothetical protein